MRYFHIPKKYFVEHLQYWGYDEEHASTYKATNVDYWVNIRIEAVRSKLLRELLS